MVKEAETNAEEDKQKKEKIEAYNNLDNMVYRTEKLLKENEKEIPEAEKKKLEEALGASKKVLENNEAPIGDFQTSLTELTNASHGLSSILYEKQKKETSSPPPPPSGESSSGSDDVIDADYKDVN